MNKAMFTLGFSAVCVLFIAVGALQCFAPSRLKEVQHKLRPRGDHSGGPSGTLFEKVREEEAIQPSWLYRLSGLMLMSIGAFMLVLTIYLLWR